MRYLITEDGRVSYICRVDPSTIFPASYAAKFRECANDAVEVGWVDNGDRTFSAPPTPPLDRQDLARKIDAAVAAVYQPKIVFAKEYELRESDATAYKAAGYSGPVPDSVAQFATPAGLSAQVATDLILQQAAQLRGALPVLGGLRMRKYAVQRAASDADAQAEFDSIMAQVAAIARQVA